MHSPLALLQIQNLLASRTTMVPVTCGVMTGLAVALFRGNIARLPLFRDRDSESIMNFASQGTLRCVCGEQQPKGLAVDRRQFCRNCGCEVVAQNQEMLDKRLSSREIKAMTSSLRKAAIRASHLELPASITTIEELHKYLANSEPENERTPPNRPTSIEQPQVH